MRRLKNAYKMGFEAVLSAVQEIDEKYLSDVLLQCVQYFEKTRITKISVEFHKFL